MGKDREDRQDRRAVTAGPPGSAYDYDAEIADAVRYERALAAKAAIPLSLVGLVILAYLVVHG